MEHGKRAVCKTIVGTLLYMCQERADILYSEMETARKVTCPTENDEMNVKRIARYLKGVPNAKCLIEINTIPLFVNGYTDSDWARQQQTCTSTSGGVTQWRSATLSAWSRTRESVSLSSAQAELYALPVVIAEGMATTHLSNKQGYESTKAWTSKRGMKHEMLKYMFVQDVVEKKQTTLAYDNTNSNKRT